MATETCSKLHELCNDYQALLKSPELFIGAQDDALDKFRQLTKGMYDLMKNWGTKENIINDDSLPELIISGFDEEQIWQQLELENSGTLALLLKNISLVATKNDISLIPKPVNTYDQNREAEFFEEFSPGSNEIPPPKKMKKSCLKSDQHKSRRTTVVDDQFFKIDELEEFLEKEERREENDIRNDDDISDDEEIIDLFQDPDELMDDEEKSGRFVKYKDFFDPPSIQGDLTGEEPDKDHIDEGIHSDENVIHDSDPEESGDSDEEIGNIGSDEDYDTADYDPAFEQDNREISITSKAKSYTDEGVQQSVEDGKSKSTFEKRQEKVKKKISEMEESNLSEKPWQLQGEIAAGARPENSLLQEDINFAHTTRQAPVITEETTQTLEAMITRRIKDQAWDDVIRKEKPKEEVFEYKKRILLNQEKSKDGLAEIYEQEYLRQKNKGDDEEKELAEHTEIRKMMSSLFLKLDALSNYSFTPKPPAPEIKIVSNLPAITAEEVVPSSVSDAALLAPEEVFAKTSGNLKGKDERTKEDKKHDRRKGKKKAHLRRKEKEKREKIVKKLNPGLGNKYSKEEALKTLEKMGGKATIIKDKDVQSGGTKITSKAFFSKLQEKSTHSQTKRKKSIKL